MQLYSCYKDPQLATMFITCTILHTYMLVSRCQTAFFLLYWDGPNIKEKSGLQREPDYIRAWVYLYSEYLDI